LLEAPGALVHCRLSDPLAGGIRPKKGLQQRFRLLTATRIRECVHERELRGLQFRIEIKRLLKPLDGLVEPAELQEAPAQFLVTLGVTGLFLEGAAQERLGFRTAALAIERGAEKGQEIRLARVLNERIAAKLFGHDAVARAQEGHRAFERGACEFNAGDRGTPD